MSRLLPPTRSLSLATGRMLFPPLRDTTLWMPQAGRTSSPADQSGHATLTLTGYRIEQAQVLTTQFGNEAGITFMHLA
jgi:hypothetical protein